MQLVLVIKAILQIVLNNILALLLDNTLKDSNKQRTRDTAKEVRNPGFCY